MRRNRRRKDPLAHISPNVLRTDPRRMARTGGILVFFALSCAIPLQVYTRLGIVAIGLLVVTGYGALLVHNALRSHSRKAAVLYQIIRQYGGHNANVVTDELMYGDEDARELAFGSLLIPEDEELAIQQA